MFEHWSQVTKTGKIKLLNTSVALIISHSHSVLDAPGIFSSLLCTASTEKVMLMYCILYTYSLFFTGKHIQMTIISPKPLIYFPSHWWMQPLSWLSLKWSLIVSLKVLPDNLMNLVLLPKCGSELTLLDWFIIFAYTSWLMFNKVFQNEHCEVPYAHGLSE